MRVRCHLPSIRGKRTVAEMARASGVPRPYLTEIERGIRLPSDEQAKGIVRAYEIPLTEVYDWEPPQLIAIELDPLEDE